jgi:hypothetical protein
MLWRARSTQSLFLIVETSARFRRRMGTVNLKLLYSRTPLNPYPFGGLLGYWLEELRLKKRFLEVWVKRGLTVFG